MIEPYTLLKFVHVAAVIIWIGGTGALGIVTARLANERDRAAVGTLVAHAAFYGRVIIAPAAVVTLLAGMAAAMRVGISLGTPWITWGFVAILLSLLLGAFPLRLTNATLGRLAVAAVPEAGRLSAARRQLVILTLVNLLLLLSAVWAMVAKPVL